MKKQTPLANIIVCLATVALCLITAEVLARVFVPTPMGHDRFMFISDTWMQNEPDGSLHLLPNHLYREAVVFDSDVEYDIKYPTNHLGLIGSEQILTDLSQNDALIPIAFVGDSFTAGVGYGDWVGELNETLKSRQSPYRVVNVGVPGVGVSQFSKNLFHFSDNWSFKTIFVFAISSDFNRDVIRYLEQSGELRFCPQGVSDTQCATYEPVGYLMDSKINHTQMRRIIRQTLEKRGLGVKPIAEAGAPKGFLRHSRFVRYVWPSIQRIRNFFSPGSPYDLPLWMPRKNCLMESLRSLAAIRKAYPDAKIYFVHLPQKEEMLAGRYFLPVNEWSKRLGFDYIRALDWGWRESYYHKKDGHPNQFGYRLMQKKLLSLLLP